MDIRTLLDNLSETQEDQHLEFKEASVGLPDDLWETYSAFANSEGGVIVLGIQENRTPKSYVAVGVADASGIIADFWKTLRNPQKVERDIMLFDGVYPQHFNGMDFVIIEVPRAERGERPVRIYDRRSKSFVAYVRRGEDDFRASDEDLRLMHYDSVPSADRKALENFGIDALNEETIHRYRRVFSSNKPHSPWLDDSDEDFLYRIGALAKGHDGAMHPTQAGLLAFGHEYEIINYAPQYLLDYREETSKDRRWDDRVVSQSGDWSGNLIDFYYLVTERLFRHFKTPFSTDEKGMSHGASNPFTEAVNEVVVNALVHSFYGSNSSIRVLLKEDELAVLNPGSLLIDWRVAVSGGFSEVRNPALMRIFSFIGASDRAGSGLQQVWETWRGLYGKEPSLIEAHSPASVSLILPLDKDAQAEPIRRPLQKGEALNVTDIMRLLNESPQSLTPQEVHEMTGISIRSAQERLKSLYDEGKVSRDKEGRFYRYSVRKF